MNAKYYFVYTRKTGSQMTKAVRYRRLAVKTCAKLNGVILPGGKGKRAVESMPLPLFPDYQEQPSAADSDKRKRQYAVGWVRSLDCLSALWAWPKKVKLDRALLPNGPG